MAKAAPAPGGPIGWRTLLAAAADEWRATPFYRLMLRGADPDRIEQWGVDARLGDPEHGIELIRGIWRIGAERPPGEYAIPWGAPPPSPHYSARLHSFSWLGDLAAAGPRSREATARVIQTWVEGFGDWHASAWAPELVAERLFAWLCHGRAAFENNPAARPALMRSVGRQARHLQLAAQDLREPLSRIKAGAALVLAGSTGMPDSDRLLDFGVELLEEAAASQFTPDGGHLSRSPEALLEALADFMAADDSLVRRGLETPRMLRELMPKLAGMLRFLRLTDGALPGFQGGGEGYRATLKFVVDEFEGASRKFNIAPQSGFYRLDGGAACVLMDCGAAPPLAYGERAHAGALAFEFSSGGDRLIVNVGNWRELDPQWRAAGRATNAHSTLIIDDALSALFEGGRGGRSAARPIGPANVSAKRSEDDDGVWIEAQHDGYRDAYGLLHRRTLHLDTGGGRLRGLDSLARPAAAGRAPSADYAPFAIRFHLHPSVTAEIVGAGEASLRAQSGAVWRFKTDPDQSMQIEDSVYLSARQGPQRTTQIVLLGDADPNGAGLTPPNRVRWAFTRLSGA